MKEFVEVYIDYGNDVSATWEQNLKFSHNIYDDETCRLYRSKIHNRGTSFKNVCDMLRNENYSPTRQD